MNLTDVFSVKFFIAALNFMVLKYVCSQKTLKWVVSHITKEKRLLANIKKTIYDFLTYIWQLVYSHKYKIIALHNMILFSWECNKISKYISNYDIISIFIWKVSWSSLINLWTWSPWSVFLINSFDLGK